MKKFLLALSLLCLLAAPQAHAQVGMPGGQGIDPGGDSGGDAGDKADDSTAKTPQQPPSPTPGSKATSAPVADATADTRSMGPTEALFDAIARGDLAAARDAIARGADLNARNVLGDKPIDASVDLGRNDITFVLLAERPLSNAGRAVATPAAATRGTTTAHNAADKPVLQAAATKPVIDNGTPRPAVGFLGF